MKKELSKLNFGCGTERKEGFYNVDIIKDKGIDKSFNFDKFPYRLKDNQFDYVLVKEVLEHCHYPRRVISELRRVCRNGAIIEIGVPYVNSRSAFSSLEHCSFFNRWSFHSLEGINYDLNGKLQKEFEIIEEHITKQRFLKWIPYCFLNLLSVFLNNIYVHIDVKLRVIK